MPSGRSTSDDRESFDAWVMDHAEAVQDALPLASIVSHWADQHPAGAAQGFFVITLPAGEITYHRPPLRFRACPVACPGAVSVT
jgi:hypothetical protein